MSDNKKRALIITSTAGFIKGFLLHDMQLLQEMGYEVHCAANGSAMTTFVPKPFFEEKNIEFHQIDFSSNKPLSTESVTAYKQVVALLKKYDFSFVHCHTPIVGAIVRLAAQKYRKHGCKVVYTTHGLAFPKGCSKKDLLLYGTVERLSAHWCDAIITINIEDYKTIKRFACKNVFYINGVGVDTERYHNVSIDRAAYRNSLGIAEDQIMVLSVGELSARKNQQVIIRALAELNDPRYVFAICGKAMTGNAVYERLQELSFELNVNTIFLGFRSDIPEINHCADIAVIPSVREGLGLAGIEALASGVPVIGGAVQGIKDYIENGKTGYLCDPRNASEFAEKIRLLSNEEVRKAMRQDCIEKAEGFNTRVSYSQMENIYRTVIQSGD